MKEKRLVRQNQNAVVSRPAHIDRKVQKRRQYDSRPEKFPLLLVTDLRQQHRKEQNMADRKIVSDTRNNR